MKRVIVHIDRLVLKGFRHEDRHAITAALQRELTRLWADPSAPEKLASLGHVSKLRVERIDLAQNAKPHQIGVSAGRAIDRGIKP